MDARELASQGPPGCHPRRAWRDAGGGYRRCRHPAV